MLLLFFPIVFSHDHNSTENNENETVEQCFPGECGRDAKPVVDQVINKKLTNAGISSLIVLCLGYGKLSRYPLRWSDAFMSRNHSINQLTLNPVLYLINTYSRRNTGYDLKKVKRYNNFAGR